MTDIELEETLAHIHQMRVDSEHKLEDMRRKIWWYPWVVVISGMIAGGALVAAGATLTKLFG